MKKLIAWILVCCLTLGCTAALAEGIGSPDKPVKVTILEKDVSPEVDPEILKIEAAIEAGMAANGDYVDLEWLEAPAGKYIDVVPLALRTGQFEADIVYFQNGVEYELAQEDMLTDLTDYVKNSTYLQKLYKDYNWTRLDNFPYLLWLAPAFTYTAEIRSDWFDQLDSKEAFLADPTPDNFYAVLKELKDKGICQYPLTTDNNKLRFDGFMNVAFGIESSLTQVDGRWVFAEVTEGTKEKFKFLNKLYKEGLLDPDFVTNAWDSMEQRFYEGTSAIIGGRVGATTKIYDDKMKATNGEQATLTILPPLKGEKQAYAAVDVLREPRGFAIMEDSEVKDAAFAVFDYMCSPEGRKLDLLGFEGEQYNVVDGKTVVTEKLAEWWTRFFETNEGLELENPLAAPLYSDAVQASIDMSNQYYIEDTNILTPNELITQKDAMTNVYNEYYFDFVTGVKDIDAEWDTYVAEWNANGGDAFADYLATVMK